MEEMDFPMDFVGGSEPPLSYDEILVELENEASVIVPITKSVKE